MKTKAPILAIIIATAPLVPSARAVWGVGDIVYDPTMHAQDTAKWSWEQVQWAEKLELLHNSLTTLRENLQTLVLVKTAIGDPSSIPMILDELALNGALSDSGLLETFNELGGIVRESGMLAMQLDYLAQPIDLASWKNAARMGVLNSLYAYNPDPLARYVAVEQAYIRYNARLQNSASRAEQMRRQLVRLNSRLGSAATDAETQKVKGSIEVADAALQNVETQIQHESEQVELARTMSENRSAQEKEAYRASLDELNQEVEANLELPVEEVASVIPAF